ncbi:MAG: hypothetical protein V2I51_12700 [Anderseniella sp.]|nr:hypothetical protein [Anderseniella sp.]
MFGIGFGLLKLRLTLFNLGIPLLNLRLSLCYFDLSFYSSNIITPWLSLALCTRLPFGKLLEKNEMILLSEGLCC